MPTDRTVPTLIFDDLSAAISYYRDFLHFDVDDAAGDGAAVLARWHDATIMLKQARPGELADRVVSWKNLDALVLVDRPYRLYRHIDDCGCDTLDGFEPGKHGFYRIMDPFQNVLAIGPRGGLLPAAKRLIWPRITDRLIVAGRTRRNTWIERPYRRAFQEFHRSLPNQQNIFYMFFLGRGLLHWVAKAASYVPAEVNLVFIGSNLPEDEQQWVRDNLGRPFHHIDIPVDDKSVWDFLLDTGEHNFGWLDIDCLVLNPGLFNEMSTVAPDTSVNGIWWYDSGFGFPITATYFQFVNMAAERALRAAGFRVHPTIHAYYPFNIDVPGARYYARVIPRKFRRQLLKLIPADDAGRPYFPGPTHPETGEVLYYDTTVVRQLMARTIGFTGNQVRKLKRRGLGGTGYGLEELSDELVHIGGVSYDNRMSQLHSSPQTKLRYLLADHVALLDAAEYLPPAYVERQRSVIEQLAGYGLDPDGALDAARRHLIDERGLSGPAAEAVLRPPSQVKQGAVT